MLNSNLPVPKFSIGQKVWFATIHRTTLSYPCPDCHDTKQWTARTAAGEFIPVHCPRCSQYGISKLPSLSFSSTQSHIESLTIGSVRIDTGDKKEPVTYMCTETGVGSGSIYGEERLFASEEDAKLASEKLAVEIHGKQEQTPQVLIAKNFSVAPLQVALKQEWKADIYHAWDRARDYREAIEEILELKEKDFTIEKVYDILEDVIQDKPWRRPHPVDQLIEAAKNALEGDSTGSLREALQRLK